MSHFIGFFTLALVFIAIERMRAARLQPVRRPGFHTDLAHVVLSNALPAAAFEAAAYTLLARWTHIVPTPGLMTHAPLWQQLLVLVALTDLSFYAMHRAMHRVGWLWRIHRVHHGIEHMDWLGGYRKHAIETVLHRAVPFLPIAMLGFSTSAWTVFGIFGIFFTGFTHLNVPWQPGWLDAIIVTPGYHSWHHAAAPAAQATNLAGKLSVLDRAFGTRQPHQQPYVGPHGLEGEHLPASWWRQQRDALVRTAGARERSHRMGPCRPEGDIHEHT